MSALTMKTSAHTDTYHALDRSGQHAVCRKTLKPATWSSLLDSDEAMTRAATFVQSGDTFKRSCSVSRVNCLACQRKLAQELAYAAETANTWQTVLLGVAEQGNRPITPATARSVAVACDMVLAGYMKKTEAGYLLAPLGLRAAGVVRAAEEQAHRWNDIMRGLSEAPGMSTIVKEAGEWEAASELVRAGYAHFVSGPVWRVVLTEQGVKASGLHLQWLAEGIGDAGRMALVQYADRGRDAVLVSRWHLLARHGLATYSAEGEHVPSGLGLRLLGYLRSRPETYALHR